MSLTRWFLLILAAGVLAAYVAAGVTPGTQPVTNRIEVTP